MQQKLHYDSWYTDSPQSQLTMHEPSDNRNFHDLEKVLKHFWQVKGGFGMYWATVKDGKPYNATTASRTIHIKVEEQEAAILVQKAGKTYGRASKNLEDYPLGINMMFVQPFNNVKGSAKALVTKLATYQQTNEKMIMSSSWFGEMVLERSISNEKFTSMRQWLMSVTSLIPKKTRNGQGYYDKLFTSIHRSETIPKKHDSTIIKSMK